MSTRRLMMTLGPSHTEDPLAAPKYITFVTIASPSPEELRELLHDAAESIFRAMAETP